MSRSNCQSWAKIDMQWSQSLDVLGVIEKKNAVFSLKEKKLRYMRASFISMNNCDIQKEWRIDAFELWCWRRLLRVPCTARRSNQSILKEISPEYSLEGLMLKLKLQYFGHLMRKVDSLEKTLMLGKVEGRRRRGWPKMRWLDGILTQWTWVWANSGREWRTGKPGMLQFMGLATEQHRKNWSTFLWLWKTKHTSDYQAV